ncbi:MAG: bifunctional (p)ppGpp synthetase/guanosine-3',5'-bis(diphosphate) 3'-pyrophosphohydrolase [Oscillospiraceae bacterium]|nr:bifunctional (p)ppGpp synthetase/guanosine-3',5'-bis(diphosphate) 3'-pyrophosphohydrolase [Oscillospiraceae bacterium]
MERKIAQVLELEFPNDEVEKQFDKLLKVVTDKSPEMSLDRIRAAYKFARKYHGEQARADGSPFVTHPISAATIFASYIGIDEESLCACLLHDLIEDTEVDYADVQRIFGENIANLVDGVTKLKHIQFLAKDEEQVGTLRKTLLATAKDPRVMLIKLADRLHNMSTLEYKTPEKQREKAAETIEIYSPIAHRFGMQRIKWELEDRSIIFLDAIACKEINDFLDKHGDELEELRIQIKERIEQKLSEYNIKAEVQSRIKHLYSIYRKMYSQNKTLTEVHDLCAFRIIVEGDSVAECYLVHGAMSEIFRPSPGKFKDYIAQEKPNGYRSLHNTYVSESGTLFEIQIRTRTMHEYAEKGVAAHWAYKGGENRLSAADLRQYEWLRNMLSAQEDLGPREFAEAIRTEMFADELMVYTPKGKVVILPSGATPIDFAYHVHSELGNHIAGAKVNGRVVPIDSILASGNIVEIIKNESSRGPSLDWLNIVKSPEARAKIRQWFRRERRDEMIALGKSEFESEMKRARFDITEIKHSGILETVLERSSIKTLDDLYASIGVRSRSASQIVNRIRDEALKRVRDSAEIAGPEIPLEDKRMPDEPATSTSGVIVDGLTDCAVKFARCCNPVRGDEIIGFVTQGHGVSVHRKDCPNYMNSIISRDKNSGRWIKVEWSGRVVNGAYLTGFYVTADERDNMYSYIMDVLRQSKVDIDSLNYRNNRDGSVAFSIAARVHDSAELESLITKMRQVRGVSNVRRVGTERL